MSAAVAPYVQPLGCTGAASEQLVARPWDTRQVVSTVFPTRTTRQVQCVPAPHSPLAGSEYQLPVSMFGVHCPVALIVLPQLCQYVAT